MEEIEFFKLYDGDYEISKCGKVRRKFKSGIHYIKPNIDNTGYLRVRINKQEGGKRKTYRLHRLLAETFIPNPENKQFIDHKNRIKTDNSLSNLRWATRRENNYNRTLKGTLYQATRKDKYGTYKYWVGGYQDAAQKQIVKYFKSKEEAQKFRDENLKQRVI